MQKKDNFYADNADLQFHLAERIDWDAVWAWMNEEQRELSGCESAEELKALTQDAMSTFGEICGSVLAPNAEQVEKEDLELRDGEVVIPPTLSKNMEALHEFGIAALSCPAEFGGMGAPFFTEMTANELLMRACPSTGLNAVWFSAVAHIVDRFGSQEVREKVLPQICEGKWSGCMALTEPDAGSDLAAMMTYGDKQPDGTYKLYGTKQFISNGNGQVALVLGMNKKGAKSLSDINLYLCLREENGQRNYEVSKLEEKVGLHGSATCQLVFDGSPAVLLGEEGKGFKAMLELMNDARIATGLQGLALMEGAHRLAADFASERKTWGKPIAHHELIAEKLLDIEVTIRGVRSLCYQASFNQSMMHLGGERLKDKSLSDDERESLERDVARYKKRVRRWTPLIKWYVGEKSFSVARDCLQIHGGYGFTKEYRAEWWVRESLILSLYEGTSQIQALMCMKDTLKEVIRNPREFLEVALGYRVKALSASEPMKKRLYKMKQLVNGAVIQILMKLVKSNVKESMSDVKPTDLMKMVKVLSRDLVKMNNISPALLHAERLCEMKALTAIAECLLWDTEVDDSRMWIAERMMHTSLTRLEALKAEIEADDRVLRDRLALYAKGGEAASDAAATGL